METENIRTVEYALTVIQHVQPAQEQAPPSVALVMLVTLLLLKPAQPPALQVITENSQAVNVSHVIVTVPLVLEVLPNVQDVGMDYSVMDSPVLKNALLKLLLLWVRYVSLVISVVLNVLALLVLVQPVCPQDCSYQSCSSVYHLVPMADILP